MSCHVLFFKRHERILLHLGLNVCDSTHNLALAKIWQFFRKLWQRFDVISKTPPMSGHFVARFLPSFNQTLANLLNELLLLCDFSANTWALRVSAIMRDALTCGTRCGAVSFPFGQFLFLVSCSLAAPWSLQTHSVSARCCWVMPSLCRGRLGSDLSAPLFADRQLTPEYSFKNLLHMVFEDRTLYFVPALVVLHGLPVLITRAHVREC